MTPVLTQDGRYLQEVTISKKDYRARPSTYSPAVFTKAGRRARPSLPTLPGTDRTIGHQGPGVRTGRLGTLVVEMLLGREDINPGMPDYNGRTPISYAAESGNWPIVELLLARGGIRPDAADHNGQTPLLFATCERKVESCSSTVGAPGCKPKCVELNGPHGH